MPVFAFTDIEGSTGLWEKHREAMGPIIAKHYAILEQELARHGGRIVKKTGDGIFAIFPDESPDKPSPSLQCALDWQQRFQNETWPVIGELRVRMAFHCGQAEEMAGDYYGPTANRTARFMALGWGGQILVSEDLQKQTGLPQGAQWQDMGVHQVKDLPEPQHVFSLLHPALKLREFPPLKSLSNRPHNFPEQLSPFVGRQKELSELTGLLANPQSRLITLLGGGGMGKSRLAIQAGAANLQAFKHGAVLVDLAASSPADLAASMAKALKIPLYSQRSSQEQVLEYLKDKTLLLVLDPCQSLGENSSLLLEMLQACPGLHVLACSRRRLNLRGERVLELRGLDYPGQAQADKWEASGCAQFFSQQVKTFQPDFAFKPEDRVPFLKICRFLQGMPLGLELAAQWLRLMPLKALAERLENDPRFLSSSRKDLPEGHRSLRALFDSSWALLAEGERDALAKLSVFRGFNLAAAQLLFKVKPETLSSLVDQCLLESSESGRYSIPERIRMFAAARLEESPAKKEEALNAHARHYCRFLKEKEKNLLGLDQAKAVAETRQEFANITRAWERAVETGMVRELGQAARSLGLYTEMQGLARDWEPRLNRALGLWEGSHSVAAAGLPWEESLSGQAGLLCSLANYCFSLGKGAEALDKIEKSLALFKKAGNRGGAAYCLVRLAVFLGPEAERRRPALEEAVALYQALGDANGAAWARRNLGYLLCRQGQAKEGKPMIEESLAVFKELGNQREMAWALNSLGQLALEAGQTEAGTKALVEARDNFLRLGDLETAAWTLNTLGQAAMRRRLWPQARPIMEESLKYFSQVGHFKGRALALRNLCQIFTGLGDLASAFKVMDQVMVEAQTTGDWAGQAGALMQKGNLLQRQQKFEEALVELKEAQAAFAKAGSGLGQALAMEAQATTCLKQGKPQAARNFLQEALQAFVQCGSKEGEARLNVRLGDLDFSEGKAEGGESYYKKALKLSRFHKPGDYSLGALLGMAALLHRQNRTLDALHISLICELALSSAIMPPSEAEFHEELAQKSESLHAKISSKLLRDIIEENKAKLSKQDLRALLRESIEKQSA